MLALGDEALEELLGFAGHVRSRDADDIESLRVRLPVERGADRARF
jgi:hypothetical protein